MRKVMRLPAFAVRTAADGDQADWDKNFAPELKNLTTDNFGNLRYAPEMFTLKDSVLINKRWSNSEWFYFTFAWRNQERHVLVEKLKITGGCSLSVKTFDSEGNLKGSGEFNYEGIDRNIPKSDGDIVYDGRIVRIHHGDDLYNSVIIPGVNSDKIYLDDPDGKTARNHCAVISPRLYVNSAGNKSCSDSGYLFDGQWKPGCAAIKIQEGDPNDDSLYEAGQVVWYGLSFVYDDWQDSQIMADRQPNMISADKKIFNLTVVITDKVLERVTGVKVWASTSGPFNTESFYLIAEIKKNEFESGLVPSGWQNAAPPGITLLGYYLSDLGYDKGINFGSVVKVKKTNTAAMYRNNTLIYPFVYNHELTPVLSCGVFSKGRQIGVLKKYFKDGSLQDINIPTIVYSEPGCPDMFMPDARILINGISEILSLKQLGPDRLIIFGNHKTVIINTSNDPIYWFIEREMPVTAISAKAVCQVSGTAAFLSSDGMFLLDETGALNELTAGWKKLYNEYSLENAGIYFDAKYFRLCIINCLHKSRGADPFYFFLGRNLYVRGMRTGLVSGSSGSVARLCSENSGVITVYEHVEPERVDAAEMEWKSLEFDLGGTADIKFIRRISMFIKAEASVTVKVTSDLNENGESRDLPTNLNGEVFVAVPIAGRKFRIIMEAYGTKFELGEISVEYIESMIK